MKATIIIPNINGKGWLKDSIESVYAQTEQDFELIVVDNGSTDESLDIARSYCGRDRYTLIENAGNTGFSHAVNQGIAIAKGEYMALFNNDAFAEPDWLAELIRTANADPKIFAVSSLMLRYYEPDLADDELRRLPHVRYVPLFKHQRERYPLGHRDDGDDEQNGARGKRRRQQLHCGEPSVLSPLLSPFSPSGTKT